MLYKVGNGFYFFYRIPFVTRTFECLKLFSKAFNRDVWVFLYCPIADGLLDSIPDIWFLI